MGWLFHNNSNQNQSHTEQLPKSEFEEAMDYFSWEDVRLTPNSNDKNTMVTLYNALVDNDDTDSDDNLVDALSTLDTNVYKLAEALIYQNFMLMRKIDALSDRIKALENKKS